MYQHLRKVSLTARIIFPPFRRPRAVFRVNNASTLRRIHYKRGVVGCDETICLVYIVKIIVIKSQSNTIAIGVLNVHWLGVVI